MDTQLSTSVHSQATSDTIPAHVPYVQVCRKRCHLEFTATQTLYRSLDAVEATHREERLLDCRSYAWFVRSRLTGLVRVASNHCRLRWCPLCARSRQGFISHSVMEWFPTTVAPKLLTFTIRHSNSPLADQISNIYRCFRSIRRSTYFRQCCYGGVWFFQITFNPASRQWHPHIHCLIDSKYMPYLKLRQLWYYYTSGSDVLDIRTVYKPKDAALYVARYASRPHDLANLPTECGQQLYRALHNRRMCGTWGTAKSISLSPYTAPKSDEWQNVGSWSTVHHLRGIDSAATAILKAYHLNQRLDEGISCSEVDAFIEGTACFAETELRIDPHPPPPSLF